MLSEDDPCWLLLLLEATVEASAGATETVRATTCQRYDALVDFEQARRIANRPVAPPFNARDTPFRDANVDLKRLPIEVWLDAPGRICRATLHGGNESLTQLDLFGFGEPERVDLPQTDEILPATRTPPTNSSRPRASRAIGRAVSATQAVATG